MPIPDQIPVDRLAAALPGHTVLSTGVADAGEVFVVSDLSCPWCWMAKRRLDRVLRGTAVTVRWLPFELAPGLPAGGADLRAHLHERLGSQARVDAMLDKAAAAGATVGLRLDFDRARTMPNTRLAHRLVQLAGPRDAGAAMEALLHGHFTQGAPIGDLGTCLDLLAAAGVVLDPAAVAAGAGAAEVERALAGTRALGRRGVPVVVAAARGTSAERFLGDAHVTLTDAHEPAATAA